MSVNVAEMLRLMLVTDDAFVTVEGVESAALAAVRGGVTSVQLRLKSCPARELVEVARRLVAVLPVPVIVNDRVDVALAAGAAGVHLGPDDLPVTLARRVAPAGFLIGASVGTEAEAPGGLGADYWGAGPWRATTTKGDAGSALGEAGFRSIVALSGGIPCIAIGGIRPGDVDPVRRAGGAGVAVVRGILGEADAGEAAGRYRAAGMTG